MIWAENNALPISPPNRKPLKALLNPIFKYGLLIKGNIEYADHSSLTQSYDIFGLSRYLKAYVNRSFFNEKYLIDLLDRLVDYFTTVKDSGFEDSHNLDHQVSVVLIVPGVVDGVGVTN